jgi:hypothetical protein
MRRFRPTAMEGKALIVYQKERYGDDRMGLTIPLVDEPDQ